MIYKNLHDINTIASSDNETLVCGTDENGKDFTLTLSTFEILEWFDTEYLKESLIKYIKQK
jgi:hypothetical protein|tara:strand:+ start:677 stop:859 length:183 start_codon:yes stop_codon:yes gene_type:complete